MSCLTKKSLFSLVLFIVCHPTFSDIINECKASVYEVFNEKMEPVHFLKYAMFSLSENLIKSMGSTQEYLNYYRTNTADAELSNHSVVSRKREETEFYFRMIISTPPSLSTAKYNISVDTKKHYILGYFNFLVKKLQKRDRLINTYAKSPDQFCGQVFKNNPWCILLFKVDSEEWCREALCKMFDVNEPNLNEGVKSLRKIKASDAFMICYSKYNHLDFKWLEFFPASGSRRRTAQEEDKRKQQVGVMVSYLNHLTEAAVKIANDYRNASAALFPTIENYCKIAEQLRNGSSA